MSIVIPTKIERYITEPTAEGRVVCNKIIGHSDPENPCLVILVNGYGVVQLAEIVKTGVEHAAPEDREAWNTLAKLLIRTIVGEFD